MVSYKVVKGPNDAVRIEVRGKQYSPEEISAIILRKLAEDGAKGLGEKVNEAVITVPAYFNDAQRQSWRCVPRAATGTSAATTSTSGSSTGGAGPSADAEGTGGGAAEDTEAVGAGSSG